MRRPAVWFFRALQETKYVIA
ncbi:hypothetical protein SBA4_2780013 [Candidatus Sulfopaludibacter sp. SbA4]|nr:hypothetical protein SBA4_2780013 [Candidatus Sulfopaludibacter sp. SbA4]